MLNVINVRYSGPLRGLIRTLLFKRKVIRLYSMMENEVLDNIRAHTELWFQYYHSKYGNDLTNYQTMLRDTLYVPACEKINQKYKNNLGLYIYPTKYSMLRFAYTDCEMKDVGVPVYQL